MASDQIVDAFTRLVRSRRERLAKNAATSAARAGGDQSSDISRGGSTAEGDLSAA